MNFLVSGIPETRKRDNLREALELFLESVSPDEIKQRLRSEVFVTQIEVAGGNQRSDFYF